MQNRLTKTSNLQVDFNQNHLLKDSLKSQATTRHDLKHHLKKYKKC